MTIAACAVTPEGVVLGADSTSTLTMTDGAHRYLNNEQKVFEVGEGGTLGLATWGLGRIDQTSHRSHIAELSDDLFKKPPAGVEDAARRLATIVWSTYDRALRAEINTHKATLADANAKPEEKKKAGEALENKALGFCVAGYWLPNREPQAYELVFGADLTDPPAPRKLESLSFWGANLFIYRVLGIETGAVQSIKSSGKWTGTDEELAALLTARKTPISLPLPLRETVDAIHALIHMTIKVMKFTSVPPVCGGSIELATITTDRRFRWVRHKTLGAALDAP